MLDKSNTNRSYLFGRLYAVLHYMQYNSRSFDKKLPTFVETNWRNISVSPKKFLTKADETANRYKLGLTPKNQDLCMNELMEIYDLFEKEDFLSDKRIDEKFNLGYHTELSFLDGATE